MNLCYISFLTNDKIIGFFLFCFLPSTDITVNIKKRSKILNKTSVKCYEISQFWSNVRIFPQVFDINISHLISFATYPKKYVFFYFFMVSNIYFSLNVKSIEADSITLYLSICRRCTRRRINVFIWQDFKRKCTINKNSNILC